jgi:hypothetical protein
LLCFVEVVVVDVDVEAIESVVRAAYIHFL